MTAAPVASAGEVDAFLGTVDTDGYQRIPLPHGRTLPGRDLSPLADVVLANIQDRSVLDVGTNHGFFPAEALRRGATSAVGVEPNPKRRAIAERISELHGHSYQILEGSTDQLPPGKFDVVLFLSVIHHVSDPIAAVRSLVAASQETVVIEFPTVLEYVDFANRPSAGPSQTVLGRTVAKVRRELSERAFASLATRLPLVAIASEEYSSFYFSPGAFENLFVAQRGFFSSVEFMPSPLRRRRMLAFCTVSDRWAASEGPPESSSLNLRRRG